ncbi:MAG: tRNA (guanosine(46)-N7)-methyltransferase TrmB [Pseudohongiellaceae bacterium]
MTDSKHLSRRPIRSYVIRGRLTNFQRKALARYSADFVIPFTDQALPLQDHFPHNAPLTIEIGFGMGQSLLQMAQQHPQQNFLGIEVYPPGVACLLIELAAQKLDNLKIVQHDATEVFTKGLPPDSVAKVLILFPDPWPKKRHHKRRIVQTEFMSLVTSRLQAGGHIHLATDWEKYAEHMLEVMETLPGLKNTNGSGNYWPTPDRPPTKFEQRGQKLGHEIWDLLYKKV